MENDDLPPSARGLLDVARNADDPTPADRARIDAAFAERLRALGMTAPAAHEAARAGSAAPAAGAGTAGKIAAAVVGAGIIALALIHQQHGGPPAPARAPHAPSIAATPSVSTSPPEVPARAAPAPREEPRAIESTPSATPGRSRRSSTPARRARSTNAGAELSAPSDSLRDEVALLEAANAALRSHRFAAALRALALHEQRFADGALREERLGMRVLALCGMGDYAAGSAARLRFLRDAPHAVLARKVAQACAPETRPRRGDARSE
jgi:hypothetical protein